MNPNQGQWSIAAAGKWAIALAVAEWLRFPAASREAVIVLCGLMLMDLFTGLWAAWATKTVDSAVGRVGISRKLGTLVFVLFVHAIERAAGVELNIEMAAALGYAFNEAVSILENFSRIGVPIPAQLVDALMQVKKLRMASKEQLQKLQETNDGSPAP